MIRTGEIAEFNSSDGFTPLQVRKLNENFATIIRAIDGLSSLSSFPLHVGSNQPPAGGDDVLWYDKVNGVLKVRVRAGSGWEWRVVST